MPYDDDSQPATGQIDGVAAASACRRSTPFADDVEAALERPSRSRRHAERVVGCAERAAEQTGAAGSRRIAAHRARLHDRGQLVHGAARVGIDRRPHAELVDGRLQRRDLRRELARGLAIAGVLDLKRRRSTARSSAIAARALQRAPSPIRTGRANRHAIAADGGPQRNREAADDARRAVGDDDGVTLRSQQPPVPSLVGSAIRSFGEVRTLPYGPTRWKRL